MCIRMYLNVCVGSGEFLVFFYAGAFLGFDIECDIVPAKNIMLSRGGEFSKYTGISKVMSSLWFIP